MEQICYTILGITIGVIGNQIAEKLYNKKQQKKQQQQTKKTKYLPSTPDLKKLHQQKQSLHLKQASPEECGDRIRKIVKIQPPPIQQFATDDELNLICDSKQEEEEEQQSSPNDNQNFKIEQPTTPNFLNKQKTQPLICFVSTSQEEQKFIDQQPITLQRNQFSSCKKNTNGSNQIIDGENNMIQ